MPDPGFPLAAIGDPAAQKLMTHYAPGPNPAQPIIQALQGFLSGGLQGVANQQGIETPQWSHNLGAILTSPEANTALGVMTGAPKTAGNIFADRVRELVRDLPDTSPFQGKVAIGQVYDAWKKANPRGVDDATTFGHRLVNAGRRGELDLARLDMPERMDKNLRLRSQTPWDDDSVHFIIKPK